MRHELSVETKVNEALDISKIFKRRNIKSFPDFMLIKNIPTGINLQEIGLGHYTSLGILDKKSLQFVLLNGTLENKAIQRGYSKNFQEELKHKKETLKNSYIHTISCVGFGCCFVTDSDDLADFVKTCAIEMKLVIDNYQNNLKKDLEKSKKSSVLILS